MDCQQLVLGIMFKYIFIVFSSLQNQICIYILNMCYLYTGTWMQVRLCTPMRAQGWGLEISGFTDVEAGTSSSQGNTATCSGLFSCIFLCSGRIRCWILFFFHIPFLDSYSVSIRVWKIIYARAPFVFVVFVSSCRNNVWTLLCIMYVTCWLECTFIGSR